MKEKNPFIPWIVVGLIVLAALAASALVITAVNNQRNQSTAANEESTPQQKTAPVTPDTTPEIKPDNSAPEEPAEPTAVEPGRTYEFNITQWGKVLDLSHKFGSARYELKDGNKTAVITSPLIDSLPDSCAAMRQEFGFALAGDKVTVAKPEGSCDAAPETYQEIWGLLVAAAKTAR